MTNVPGLPLDHGSSHSKMEVSERLRADFPFLTSKKCKLCKGPGCRDRSWHTANHARIFTSHNLGRKKLQTGCQMPNLWLCLGRLIKNDDNDAQVAQISDAILSLWSSNRYPGISPVTSLALWNDVPFARLWGCDNNGSDTTDGDKSKVFYDDKVNNWRK